MSGPHEGPRPQDGLASPGEVMATGGTPRPGKPLTGAPALGVPMRTPAPAGMVGSLICAAAIEAARLKEQARTGTIEALRMAAS